MTDMPNPLSLEPKGGYTPLPAQDKALEIYGRQGEGFSGSYTDDGSLHHLLKNCPFCGERDDLEICNTHTRHYWVDCNNCGGHISPVMPPSARLGKSRSAAGERRKHMDCIEAAIKGWNTRATGA